MNAVKMLTKILTLTLLLTGFAWFTSGCATTHPTPKSGSSGKLNHIGLIWLKNPGNTADQAKIIAAAHEFAREIPEVQFLSVGKSVPKGSPLMDTTFDICLTMQFDDQAALERYARHPIHEKAAKEVFLPLSQKIIFYDFISE